MMNNMLHDASNQNRILVDDDLEEDNDDEEEEVEIDYAGHGEVV